MYWRVYIRSIISYSKISWYIYLVAILILITMISVNYGNHIDNLGVLNAFFLMIGNNLSSGKEQCSLKEPLSKNDICSCIDIGLQKKVHVVVLYDILMQSSKGEPSENKKCMIYFLDHNK